MLHVRCLFTSVVLATGAKEYMAHYDEWLVRSECKAYIISIKCLWKLRQDNFCTGCKGTKECEREIASEMTDHVSNFYNYYKCSARGFSL